MKNFKWKLEYTVTLFVLFGILLLLLPISAGNTWQAGMISKWNERYNRIDYVFSVINVKMSDIIQRPLIKDDENIDREQMMMLLVKPYFKIDTSKKVPKRYKIRYMDKTKVIKGQYYYFEDFYFKDDGSIIGIKDVDDVDKKAPIFIMMFDLNGLLPPNTWGKDVFGVNIYNNGNVEPFGWELSMDALVSDCSPKGTGLNCSYYYKIGGSFDDK